MNMKTLSLSALFSAMILPSAGILANIDEQSPLVARPGVDYEAIAASPIKTLRYKRIYNFETIDDRHLILWTGRKEPYLLTTFGVCLELEYAFTVSFTGGPFQIRPGIDRVITNDRRCLIETIRPLDFDALKAARKAAKEKALSKTD